MNPGEAQNFFLENGVSCLIEVMDNGSIPTYQNTYGRFWVVGGDGNTIHLVEAKEVLLPLFEGLTTTTLENVLKAARHPREAIVAVRSPCWLGVGILDCRGYLQVEDGGYL